MIKDICESEKSLTKSDWLHLAVVLAAGYTQATRVSQHFLYGLRKMPENT